MKVLYSVTTVAALAFILHTTGAHAAVQASDDVVQVGDNAMSCPALAAEINSLQQGQARKAKAASTRRSLMSFAGGALQAASPYLGSMGGSSASGLIGSVAAQGAMTVAITAQSSPVVAPVANPSDQRLERLHDLFNTKGC